jgi:hypothetical protein
VRVDKDSSICKEFSKEGKHVLTMSLRGTRFEGIDVALKDGGTYM